MTFKQKLFAIITSIFIVLVIDQLFLHVLFPIKKAAFLKNANHEVQQALQEHPPLDDVNQMDSSAKVENKNSPKLEARPSLKLTDFRTAAGECLGGVWSTPAQIALDLEKTYGVQSKNKDIENYHLTQSNGEERRIHISIESVGKKQVQYFKVDQDGLPTPIALSETQRKMPSDQLINELKKDGKLFFYQSKERWLLGNGSTFIVTFENNVTREFQIFGPSKTLSCLEESCQCL